MTRDENHQHPRGQDTPSRLIDRAAKGKPFVIAKAGKPLVKVSAVDAPEPSVRRTGFLKGPIKVPDDFDRMGSEEIEELLALRG
jgi:antitoxin (DNA-binding transcriptional repressor) of toxin-antitoxin stability system